MGGLSGDLDSYLLVRPDRGGQVWRGVCRRGANNPVREVWDQAQLAWGPEPLEGKVKCLVSIWTGVPSLKPFRDGMLHIGKTLVAIATETADGRAIPARAGATGTGQHGTVLPVQRSAGPGKHSAGRGEERSRRGQQRCGG
jgi:hypothetical protein